MGVTTYKRTFGPVAVAAAAANVYNNASALIYDVIRQIHVANTTAGALTFNLFLSAVTGTETAGKELMVGVSIPANQYVDWYCVMKMVSTDFLVAHGSLVGLTVTGFGEQYVV